MNVLCDDVNFELLKLGKIGKFYVDMMVSSSLEQHITLPMRISGISKKLFDHISSNSSPTAQSGDFDTSISDHHIIFAFIPCCIERKLIHTKIRDHTEKCLAAL